MKILVVSDIFFINFTMPAFVIVSSVYNEVGVIINWQSWNNYWHWAILFHAHDTSTSHFWNCPICFVWQMLFQRVLKIAALLTQIVILMNRKGICQAASMIIFILFLWTIMSMIIFNNDLPHWLEMLIYPHKLFYIV